MRKWWTDVRGCLQPTAELDRSGDQVYTGVMAIVKQVVQMKNDVNAMPASEYPACVKVGSFFSCDLPLFSKRRRPYEPNSDPDRL